MNPIIYEHHRHDDPKFPIIFHYDTLESTQEKFIVHYHENIEILYFVKGSGVATCGSNHVEVKEGDLLVVNSNELHFIYSKVMSGDMEAILLVSGFLVLIILAIYKFAYLESIITLLKHNFQYSYM